MANFDDLVKGLAVFNQGVKQLAVSSATNDANEQINQLNQQQLSREDDIKARAAIGNQLGLRLQSAGADAADIQATAARLTPSAGEIFQAQTAQEQQATAQKFAQGQQSREFQQQKEIEQMKLNYMQKAMQFKTAKMADQYGKEFFNQNKDDFKKLNDIQTMKSTIDASGGNPAGANLAQMSFVKAAVGRANWQEIQMGNPNQAIMKDAYYKLGIQFTNKDLTNKGAFFKKLAQAEEDHLLSGLDKSAQGFAQAKQELEPGIDASTLYGSLKNQHLAKYGYSGTTAAAAAGAAKPQAAPQPPAGGLTPQPSLPPGFKIIGQ
jgi:hypothetical protein